MSIRKLSLGVVAFALALAAATGSVKATTSTVVVTEATLADNLAEVITAPTSWFFFNDEDNTIDSSLGSFVSGPATAPAGVGSAQMSVSGTQRRNIATYQFSGTALEDITTLAFSTYNPSAGNGGSANRSAYLQFNVDFDGSDTWQRRLVYLPSDNGSVTQDAWQEWDTVNGGDALWRYSGPTWPVTGEPGSTTKTWSQILSDYPGVRVRVNDSWMGLRVGEPYADGYTENVDAFKFGVGEDVTVFDFEPVPTAPTNKMECINGGWATFTNPVFASQGKCMQYVERLSKNMEEHAQKIKEEKERARLLKLEQRAREQGQQ